MEQSRASESRVPIPRLAEHLANTYGTSAQRISELDAGVFRVERTDGPSWVARVFPRARAVSEVEGDARILGQLESGGFPAERCAHPDPVSTLDGHGVLVTEFVERAPNLRPGQTFAILGALLGVLASRPIAASRPGGAWHILTDGDPRAELAAARELLGASAPRDRSERLQYDILRGELADLPDFGDLPTAFIHADFVPANALPTPAERLIIVDWAGSGIGPRVWPLGFLLYAAGARSPKLVELVVSRYRRRVELEDAELAVLEDAICARAIVLATWEYCTGRALLPAALESVQEAGQIALRTAAQVRGLLRA